MKAIHTRKASIFLLVFSTTSHAAELELMADRICCQSDYSLSSVEWTVSIWIYSLGRVCFTNIHKQDLRAKENIMDSAPKCELRNKYKKLLEENIGSTLLDINLGVVIVVVVFDLTPKAKAKINMQNYIKLKSFCTAKDYQLNGKLGVNIPNIRRTHTTEQQNKNKDK